MKGKKILLIDDDLNIRKIVKHSFSSEGAEVFQAENGRVGMRLLYEIHPDLVILDVMMPVQDGWETCQQIRTLTDVPVIMLTSLDGESEIIRGLDYGADDFVTKPFQKNVLLARARAVLRRVKYSPKVSTSPTYHDEYLEIDINKRSITVDGESIKLTPTEFNLLVYLVSHKGMVMTFDQILKNVWGWAYRDAMSYVHVYISHLRKKIEKDPKNPTYITTEHGIGYRFEPQT